ncbi:hypothetical protein I5Q34_00950 [Streptomyces sp. AV19]|uniref:hypothetical protein n=1 Tax=Streptomyces sp. AV19 TaxID=2793068 RepID=UPI0018FE4E37|nr:hypothetical protein [Streptomyces sp. AV19]MBH1932874.1 hypothetical protein [Streptomyces sp. AV19]MDG4531552.1 hypothetical protein [Streptomyces sp. AV19]
MLLPRALRITALRITVAGVFAACAVGLAAVGSVPVSASAGDRQECGDPGSPDFPIVSRLSGGPAVYERGADAPAWELDLRNDTGTGCRAVHPVVVLSDRSRALRPQDVRMEFYDREGARWRPVRFERTEEAENVGVLEGRSPDFRGFDVPAHRTVAVPLRLGFADGAPEGPVTANVTAVQRRGADGAWVGESEDYTFTVGRAAAAPVAPGPTPRASLPGGERPGPPVLAETGASRAVDPVEVALLALGCVGGGVGLLLWARRMRR